MKNSNWVSNNQEIGMVTEGELITIFYVATKAMDKKVLRVSASCGCTKPNYDEDLRTITVKYTPNKVPKYVRERGWYKQEGTVLVKYEDGDFDELTFTGVVKVKE